MLQKRQPRIRRGTRQLPEELGLLQLALRAACYTTQKPGAFLIGMVGPNLPQEHRLTPASSRAHWCHQQQAWWLVTYIPLSHQPSCNPQMTHFGVHHSTAGAGCGDAPRTSPEEHSQLTPAAHRRHPQLPSLISEACSATLRHARGPTSSALCSPLQGSKSSRLCFAVL